MPGVACGHWGAERDEGVGVTEGRRPAQSAGGEGGRKEGEEHAVPLMALDTSGLVRWMVAVLMAKAWQCLTPAVVPEAGAGPGTGQGGPTGAGGAGGASGAGTRLRRDLAGARVAIDAVNALLPVVEGKVRPEEASQLRLAVAELRLEWVRAQGAGGGAGGGGGDAVATGGGGARP